MLKLKQLMDEHHLTMGVLATAAEISRPVMCQIVNNNVWPKKTARAAISLRLRNYLDGRGITAHDFLEEVGPDRANDPAPKTNAAEVNEGVDMILRKQSLTALAREHFNLARDPFGQDPSCPDDVFLTQNAREILADMESAVFNGRFIGVVGESGSGKSTLFALLEEQLRGQAVTVIKPYILGMEDSDREGRKLRMAHIEEAVIHAIDPAAKIKQGAEGRQKQMHQLIKDVGQPCVLVIEEAHSLPKPTLRHFKRLRELKDGMRQLLGVLLIAQPELEDKLSTSAKDVREVTQRCEIVHLQHLGRSLQAYVEHRFQRAKLGSCDRIFEAEALEAFGPRLEDVVQQRVRSGSETHTMTTKQPMHHPLAVGNLAVAAMNMAAQLGMPKVTADIVWRAR